MSMVFVVGALKPNVKDIVDSKTTNEVFIPKNAVEISPGVFDLGKAKDKDGKIVSGLMFVHNKKESAKPDGVGGRNGGGKCYEYFAKGAKWKNTEPYVTGVGVNLTLTEMSLNTWDSEVLVNVFGTGVSGLTDGADTISPDDKNEVMFEYLGSTGTIAYAVVWGIFYGPPSQRELIEWDVVFNNYYFDSDVMDYQNIATHEFGHALGMAHPQDSCTEETMYAYASPGETKKRSLGDGDIVGIQKLYGTA